MYRQIERALLALAVFSLGLSAYAIQIPGVPLSSAKVATALALGVVALGFVVNPRPLPHNAKNLWAAAFFFGSIPGFMTSVILGGDAGVMGALLTPLSLVLFYYLLVIGVRTPADVRLMLWAFAASGAVSGLTSILGIGVEAEGYYERAGGLGGNANLAALNAVSALGVSFALFVTAGKQWFARLVLVAMMSSQLLALVYSVSRAGFVSVLAMGGFVLVASRRLDLLRWAIPSAFVIGLLLVYVAPDRYFERISTIEEEAGDLAGLSLDNKRIRGWYWGLRAFASYPLSGVGPKTYRDWANDQPGAVDVGVPHNSYIYLLAAFGLPGFVPWAALMALSFFDLGRARRLIRSRPRVRDPDLTRLEVYSLYLQGVLVAWMVAGLVSPFETEKVQFLVHGLATPILFFVLSAVRAPERDADLEPSPDPGGMRGEAPASDAIVSTWTPR